MATTSDSKDKKVLSKKSDSLSNLYAQKALALSRSDTLNAKRIQAVIDCIEKGKKK